MENGIAYIADGNNGVQIVNVTNPRQPELYWWRFDTLSSMRECSYLAKRGDYLFIRTIGYRHILNVSDPRNVTTVWSSTTIRGGWSVSASGNRMAVTEQSRLSVWDISNESTPVEVASYPTTVSPFDAVERNGFLFVANLDLEGLQVFRMDAPPQVFPPAIRRLTRGETRTITWHTEGITSPDWSITEGDPSQANEAAVEKVLANLCQFILVNSKY